MKKTALMALLFMALSSTSVLLPGEIHAIDTFFLELEQYREHDFGDVEKQQLATRFFDNLEKAHEMLKHIMAGFNAGALSGYPDIQVGFLAINDPYHYPILSHVCIQRLQELRSLITSFQNFLSEFRVEKGAVLDDQQFAFVQLLQRFNTFMLSDVLHEMFLPLMEGYYDTGFAATTRRMKVPLTFFAVGSLGWLGARMLHNHNQGCDKILNSGDVVSSLVFGAVLGYFGYSLDSSQG